MNQEKQKITNRYKLTEQELTEKLELKLAMSTISTIFQIKLTNIITKKHQKKTIIYKVRQRNKKVHQRRKKTKSQNQR